MLSVYFTSANDMSGEFECLVSAVNRDAFMSPTHRDGYRNPVFNRSRG